MSVLIDTSIWALALRRARYDLNPIEKSLVFQCRDLTISGNAVLIGPILQETLSGISDPPKFEQVKARMLCIRELAMKPATFVVAAEFFNTCRRHGIAPGPIDMTLCAAAHLHDVHIFTTDPDFLQYARLLPIGLHGQAKA